MTLLLHVAFVGALLGMELFSLWTTVLNVRHTRTAVAEERAWLSDVLGMDDPGTVVEYVRSRLGLQGLRMAALVGWTLTVLYAGGLDRTVAALEATGWPYLLRGVAFFLAVTVAYWLVSLPFDAYETFVVDESFDRTDAAPAAWARNAVVELAVSLAVTGALSAVLLWVLEALPTTWWLVLWVLTSAITILMQVLYPRAIAPLFHDLSPVEDGELRETIDEVFARAGVERPGVYVADTGDGSGRKGAYFAGVGSLGRVVLFDGLVETMDDREIQSIVAHELAHRERGHALERLAADGVKNLFVYGAMYAVVATGVPGRMFGIPPAATYASLVVAGLWTAPISRFAAPLKNRVVQSNEYEADAYAVDVVGDAEPLSTALARLSNERFTNPFPHPLYATFNREHPSTPERIRNVDGEPGTPTDPAE